MPLMLPMPEFKPFTHNAEDRFAQNQSLKATVQQNSLAAMLGAGVATAATAVGLRRASQYGGFDDVKTGVQEQKPITPTATPQEPLQLTYRPEVSVPQELGAPPVPSQYYFKGRRFFSSDFWDAPQYTMSTTTPQPTTD